MSFSGGVYTLPGPALVTGEVVSATENNQFRNDVAGAFNLTMLRNGTSTATANLPMGGYKLTGLGAATTSGDALSYGNAAVVTTLTSTSLTATRVPYAGTGGLLQDASTFTFDGTTLTAGGFSTAGSITLSGGTANGVAYLNGSKVLTTGSALTFDGTNGGTTGTWQSGNLASTGGGYIRTNRSDNATYNEIKYATGDLFYFNQANGGAYQFNISGSEQMRLTSTGLGIGTSSPSAKLQIVSTGAASIIGSSGASNVYSQWNYNSSAVGYLGNGAAIVSSGAATDFAIGATNKLWMVSGSGSQYAVLDSSGNLGLGVTPSAWTPTYRKAIQLGTYSALSNDNYYALTDLSNNVYESATGVYRYIASDGAAMFRLQAGAFKWFFAPSGTAGTAASFTQAMTLDASGNLGVGSGSASAMNFQSGGGLVVYNPTGQSRLILRNDFTGSASTDGFQIIQQGTESGNANVNLLQYENAAMLFGTNGSERMRIDSSGNVGIGTSSPATKLNVANGAIRLTDSYEIGWGANTAYLSGNSSSNTLLFNTSNTERMRIDSSGNLLVGTTGTLSGQLSVYNGIGIRASDNYNSIPNIRFFTGVDTTGGIYCDFLNTASSRIGSISRGGVSTIAYNTSSDYRLKENIQPMQNALATVAQLNPVTYTWKADGSDGQGFIAHELQAVVPDCVTGEKDAVDEKGNPVYQGIDTSFLVATLTAAIKELKAELDATKAEVAALKGN